MLGNKPDIVRDSIKNAIYNTYGEYIPIDETVYYHTNNYLELSFNKDNKYYTKALTK